MPLNVTIHARTHWPRPRSDAYAAVIQFRAVVPHRWPPEKLYSLLMRFSAILIKKEAGCAKTFAYVLEHTVSSVPAAVLSMPQARTVASVKLLFGMPHSRTSWLRKEHSRSEDSVPLQSTVERPTGKSAASTCMHGSISCMLG